MKNIVVNFLFSFFFLLSLVLLANCGGAKKKQAHNHSGENTGTEASTNYKCSHCGMNSKQHPQWNAVVTSEKGEQWFCSPRCTFQIVLDEENAPKNITSIKVTDYYETKKIDAKTAYYVIGSDIMGSMGADLIPFKNEASAKDFVKEHQGKKILKFEEVSLKVVKKVTD